MFEDLIPIIEKIKLFYQNNTAYWKDEIIRLINEDFPLFKIKRSLYADTNNNYIVRFLWTKFDQGTPSNTFLSIKTIYEFDDKPIIVVLVRPNSFDISLGNTSFVSKVSHSSKNALYDENTGEFTLSGSVNYPNIYHDWNDFDHIVENWEFHYSSESDHNIRRILKKTSEIEWNWFEKVVLDDYTIETFVRKSMAFHYETFADISAIIDKSFYDHKAEIIEIFDNEASTKRRGEKIQSVITWIQDNDHEFADMYYEIWDKSILLNIKTIDLTLPSGDSSPQAFNIDKLLNNIDYDDEFTFYFFVITKTAEWVFYSLVNFLEERSIQSYGNPMNHWSWQNARWHMQVVWIADLVLNQDYTDEISYENSVKFLSYLNSL